jgi:hypothetical protein
MASIVKAKYTPLTLHQKYTIRALHQVSGMKIHDIIKKYKTLLKNVPRSTIYATAKVPLKHNIIDKRFKNKAAGRPRKISARGKSLIRHDIPKMQDSNINFTSTELQQSCDMMTQCSNATFRRTVNDLGYGYRSARRKGILTDADKAQRYKYAKKIEKEHGKGDIQLHLWRLKISIYTDIVGFEHKTNPSANANTARAKVWRRVDQGLTRTAKGKKEGVTSVRHVNYPIIGPRLKTKRSYRISPVH